MAVQQVHLPLTSLFTRPPLEQIDHNGRPINWDK